MKRLLAMLAAGVTAIAAGAAGKSWLELDPNAPSPQHVSGSTLVLEGNRDLQPFVFDARRSAGIREIDARNASFILANSGNADPTADRDCSSGSAATNPYPFRLRHAPGLKISGGLFQGRVPQNSDWRASYCNSAAMHLRDSSDVVIRGVRVEGAWDGLRLADGSTGVTLSGSWLSNIADDAIENDYLQALQVSDTLIDGTFQGISLQPGKGLEEMRSPHMIDVAGLLIRFVERPYRGDSRFGALTKNRDNSPRMRISDSVVAIDYRGGTSWPAYWERSWSLVEQARNNRLLWLSPLPIPDWFPRPPQGSGFEVLTGEPAQRAWEEAKQNWINCHPDIQRLRSDPQSHARRCDRTSWGGNSAARRTASLAPW